MAEESVEEREGRARNSTSPAELENLAKDEDCAGPFPAVVRQNVAGNANTPVPVLEKLAEDKDEWVREAAKEIL